MEKNGDSFFFSVVVPVYNVKKYLRKCVQSIAEQEDFGDTFEIILIDDGSCDGSEYICEELEAQYSFLHVIHQKNAGLGAARNAGIRLAKGKYLLFVDADDFISKDSLYHIWAEVKKNRADLYFLESRKYYETGKRSMVNDGRLKMVSSLGKAECMKLFSILSRYPGSAWDKLVRRDFILENQIFFEEHVLSEDLIWVLKCLLFAESYYYIEADYYNYRQGRSGSITDGNAKRRATDLLHAIQQGIILAKSPIGEKYQREIYSMMAYEAEVLLLFLGMMKRTERKSFRDKAESILWLLKYRHTRRTKCICFLVRNTGTLPAASFIKFLYLYRKRIFTVTES